MKMKKVMLSIFVSSMILLTLLTFASADVNDSSNMSSNGSYVEHNYSIICTHINQSVTARINAFENGNVERIKAFNSMESSVQAMINNASARGVDVTNLTLQYNDLKSKIDKFNSDYATFISKLEGLSNYTCGSSEGQFRSALNDAKLSLPLLSEDAKAIRLQMNSIKQDLVQIRLDREQGRLNRIENRTANNMNRTNERIQNISDRINRTDGRLQNLSHNRENIQNRTFNGTRFANRTRFENGTNGSNSQ